MVRAQRVLSGPAGLRKGLLHLILAGGFYLLFLGAFALLIRWYTHHGEQIAVPDLKGLDYAGAAKLLRTHHLQAVIADSSYQEGVNPLVVLDQVPGPGSFVKKDRKIYLTVNSRVPPQVALPDLRDVSLKQAAAMLNSYGLKPGQLIYKPDLAKDVVLEMRMGGKAVAPGMMVSKGSRVDLVLGDGLGTTEVPVPDLIGLSLREARFVLDGSGLQLGAVVVDASVVRDTLDAIVYRQLPAAAPDQMMHLGEGVDVFVTSPLNYEGNDEEEQP
ncbi:MAG: PASTA domain-containing protein [Chitinophagales bacterium]|nr:PASTA domain-containing protein [Chitinophagales bacterium]MDW8393342.1 PASTA domain-containing protein [Chitinophagales bacterium]